MGYKSKQRILNGENSSGQETHKNIHLTYLQRNANQNYFEIPILHLSEFLKSIKQVTAHGGEDVAIQTSFHC